MSVEHDQPGDDRIKVWFRFVPREGWLPIDTEGLWATRLTPDTARIDNVAFLQDGVAQNDVIRFRTEPDGRHWATGRVTASGHCVIRVIAMPGGPLGQTSPGDPLGGPSPSSHGSPGGQTPPNGQTLPDGGTSPGDPAAAVHDAFARFGLGGEVFSRDFPMVAFDVPADADLPGVKRLLDEGTEKGWWQYEVGCATDHWWSA
ncbi:DUF4265 domain-containing protein [Actinoplanes sp. CA-252034]|uniref:DUF4265 domain-containing protein n=1 Tax=Actinoplanes sp. CA-252034 TaxID=3239906 RepID=UPI003D95E43F